MIAHLGFPTETFKSPLIYNPFFDKASIDAAVVPMGVQAVDFPSFLPDLFKLNNIGGAFVTMPHKMIAIELADEVSPTARIAGAANVLRKRDDGSLVADMFDGEGFARGVSARAVNLLIIGAGGVGSAIAASLAAAGVTRMGLVDAKAGAAESLVCRLYGRFPDLTVRTGSADPTGYDLVVNATPLGMNDGDPLPIDMNLLSSTTFVGEVVMKSAVTPFLWAARERGCCVATAPHPSGAKGSLTCRAIRCPMKLSSLPSPGAAGSDLREYDANALSHHKRVSPKVRAAQCDSCGKPRLDHASPKVVRAFCGVCGS